MFHSPWYLLLLLLLPFLAWRLFSRRGKPSMQFSSVELATRLTPTLRQRMNWLPGALTLGAILFLILGMARPREGREQTIVDREGIAIEMVVDRSSSMQAMDFQIDGNNVDRLTAIKNVAGKFVSGGDDLEGRFSDRVGLITFAGYADGRTPPTLDHTFLTTALNDTEIVQRRDEDGTAIGDALALAVEKLNGLDEHQEQAIKSKIIILLTDGENNAGELDPIQAAEIAQTMGIKVYTIGVGTKGQAPIPTRDRFTGRTIMRWTPVTIDEETLRKVASITDAKYFRATDTDSLTLIYEEIDKLEKTKVEADHFVDYRELAVVPYSWGLLNIPPMFLVAFVLLAGRVLIQQTWLRELI